MDLQTLYRDGYYYWLKSYPYFEFDINQREWCKWHPPPCSREITECYADLETVELKHLEVRARQFGYTLNYFIRPRSGARFSEVIWKTLFLELLNHPKIRATPIERRAQRLAALAREQMLRAEFQRRHNWRWNKKFRVY